MKMDTKKESGAKGIKGLGFKRTEGEASGLAGQYEREYMEDGKAKVMLAIVPYPDSPMYYAKIWDVDETGEQKRITDILNVFRFYTFEELYFVIKRVLPY